MKTPPAEPSSLALGEAREAALDYAAELVLRAWREFDQARDQEPVPSAALLAALAESLPEDAADVRVQLDLAAAALDTSIAQSRPRFLAYVGSSGLEIGALADLLAHSYDPNLAIDAGSATRIESQTIEWLAEFVGYPADCGFFTSGGTISNITALAAARERALPGSRINGVRVPLAVYCSEEVHYSVVRGAELLGIGRNAVRAVPLDGHRRMDPQALDHLIAADIATGVIPMAVVATSGTTLTGAIDPLDALADVCEKYDVWLHVDGAYGLPAAGAPTSAPLFAGLARAHSVSVDAHKWLFVPKACSAIMVRDRQLLAAAFAHNEAYIPHVDNELNAVDVTLEYSRPLRALKLWLAFRVHGARAFRAALERNLAQAQLLYELTSQHPRFEVQPLPPQLSITPIRHVVPDCSDVDAHNDALCRALIADGRVYISPAIIDGSSWLRPCFTNFRTTDHDVRVALETADEVGLTLCSSQHNATH